VATTYVGVVVVKEVVVYGRNVREGRSKRCQSCGHAEPRSDIGRNLSHVPKIILERLRQVAWDAIRRCSNKEYPQFHDYGGRGIKVKFTNRDSFIEHLATLLGHDDLSLVIDRIDNDGNYEAGNLRFVTRSVSQQNQRPRKIRGALRTSK
jgi:hypothetical protein